MCFQKIQRFQHPSDKNHNPRKGTETYELNILIEKLDTDKNHNPRKGTETFTEVNNAIFVTDEG